MSGITSFTANPKDGALNFHWTVSSNVTVDTISKVTIILNDFGPAGAMQSYSIDPVVTDLTSGIVTGLTLSTIIDKYQEVALKNGVEYGAALIITLKNGTSYSKGLASSIKPLSVPSTPVVSVVAIEKAIKVTLLNYLPNNHGSTGFTPLTYVYVYLSENKNKKFTLLKYTASEFGSDYKNSKLISNGDVVNGAEISIVDGNEYEVAIQTENSQGLSPITQTFYVTPTDLPGVIMNKVAVPTIVYSGVSEKSVTVLFGNTSDQSELATSGYPIKSYSVYRYNVDASFAAINSSKTIINTIATDASGLTATPDLSYNYSDVNYPFIVVDATVELGKEYIYSIAATNANGEGLENNTALVRAGMRADAPTLIVTPSDKDIFASATKPANMGGFLPYTTLPDASGNFRYFFTYTWSYLDASSVKQIVATKTSADASVSSGVTLVNGKEYTVEAQAITQYKTVDYLGATVSKTSVPYGAAPAPAALSLESVDANGPLNAALDASWNAVTNKNGSTGSITYSVLVQDSSSIYQVFASGITSTTYKLTGLTNGKSYSVKVRADVYNEEIKSSVAGVQSSEASAIPFTLPAAATNLVLTRPSDYQLKLTFDACANLTGLGEVASRSKVIVYEITNNVLGVSSETILDNYPMELTYNGDTGKSYQFNVYTGVIQNSVNYFNANPQIISGTARGIPSLPREVNAVPINTGIRLLWDAPLSLNGVKLEGYKIYVNQQSTPYATIGVTPEYYIIEGLANDTEYEVQIKAYGSALNESNIEGEISSVKVVKPNPAPIQPQNLTAAPSAGKVTISWNRDNSLARPIKGYRITKDDNLLSEVNLTPGTGSSGKWSWTSSKVAYLADGLTNGTTYTFKVSSFTSSGVYSEDATITAIPFAAPSEPTLLVCSVGSNTINSTWAAPSSTAGANLGGNGPILYKYMIDASYVDASSVAVTTNILTVESTSDLFYNFTSSELLDGRRYIVSVLAFFIGVDGNKYPSPVVQQALIVNAAPKDISNLTVTPGNKQNILAWSNPTDSTLYTRDAVLIYVKVNGGAESLVATLTPLPPFPPLPHLPSVMPSTYTHDSLLNGASYVYRVVSRHTATTAQQVSGVSSAGAIPFGKAFLIYPYSSPNVAGFDTYVLKINKNGSDLQDYVAIGALPDGSGNINIPVLQGTVTNAVYTGTQDLANGTDANQVYDLELKMGVKVSAIMVIIENAAGFTTKTIPTGASTPFGQL